MRWLLIPLVTSGMCACEEKKETPVVVDAGAPPATTSASATTSAAPSVSVTPMPPRPLPAGSTTVGSGAPEEVQMKAIGYMMALQQPHENDPGADLQYATDLAAKLRPIVQSLDKGGTADKQRMGGVEVLAGGRRIDLLLASGCDAQLPQKAVVQRAGVALPTLLTHGVLVVRCNDGHFQCLQNTRDAADVLCTTAPRHK